MIAALFQDTRARNIPAMGIEDFNIDSDEHCEHVLIISSPQQDVSDLKKLISKRGYKAIHVTSVAEASTIAVRQLFDLIVIDQREGHDGPEELMNQISADLCLKRSPLLVINPIADPELIASSAEPGRDVQYLPSPFSPSVFLVKVATLLRLRKFTSAQVGFESQIASQNAELRDLTNRFKQELREARAIQQSILPKQLPTSAHAAFAACFMPLEAVGGDMFDIWKIDKHRYGLFIADVSGHGLAAAFIGAMTKMALEYAPKNDPAKMLEHMNEGIYSSMPEGRFATAAAVFYDDSNGRLLIGRCGHPPPLVWRKSSGEVIECSPRGLPLGVAPVARYECLEMTLERGDKLLMVTDGLTETSDMDGNMLGVDGTGRIFADCAKKMKIDKCLESVLDEQKRFSGGRLTKDDNTLLGLELL